jgi:hypothetical protein
MREALGGDFEGNTNYFEYTSLEDALNYDAFPGMMKPTDSQGQRGCFRVECKKDISKEFQTSMDFSHEGKVIIEEFLDGPEASVNAFFIDGEMSFALVSDRISFDEYPGGIIKEHLLPSKLSGETQEKIKAAMGGVLFIDEAYALSDKGENDFGHEAIDTILKYMEDHRDDIVIVVAGYDGLMEDFIQSNPGLESRFNRFLHFDDYTLDEMVAIFKMRCDSNKYVLGEGAEEAVRTLIQQENENAVSFGNARGVRNLFEDVLVRQAGRLAAAENITAELLMELRKEDILPENKK